MLKKKRKTKKSWVSLLLCAMLMLQLLPIAAQADSEDLGLSDLASVVDFSPSDAAFSSFTMSTSLSNDDLAVSFEFALDDNYLSEKYLGYIESLAEGADDPTDDEINAVTDESLLPSIGFTLDCILSGSVGIPSDASDLLGTFQLTTDDDVNIGTYTVALDEDDDTLLHITCSLNKLVYNNRTDVSGGGSMSLTVAGENASDPALEVDEENNAITISVTVDQPGGGVDPDNVTYSLTKTAAKRDTTDPNISYTITAAAAVNAGAPTGTVAQVNGLTIYDTIPDGLDVISVEYGGGVLAEDEYTLEDGLLSFTFPAYDEAEDNGLTTASITINTRLSTANYKAYLTSNAAYDFQNTAQLKNPEDDASLATSNTVSSAFEGDFMSKDGKLVGVNGGEYLWTIKANTYFSTSGHVYLVDTLYNIDSAHMYIIDNSEISYYVNGSITARTAALTSSEIAYEDLSIGDLNDLTDYGDEDTTGSGGAVYYTYDSDGDESPDRAVLIIPLSAADIEAPLTVTYSTKIVSPYSTDNESRTLTNTATMMWDVDGLGEGEGSTGSFVITKDVSNDYSIIKKSAGSYDAATRTMTWSMTVNQAGQALTDAVITDILDDGVQAFAGLTVQKTDGSGTTGVAIGQQAEGYASTPYYSLTQDGTTHETTLRVHLGNIAAGELYTLTLRTTVVDLAFLSQQTADETISNTATINTMIGPTSVEKSSEVSKTISNTLIQKDALKLDGSTVGSEYDYASHAVNWRVTVNPNHVTIKDAAVTDTLPLGTSFGELKSVKRYVLGQTDPISGTISNDAVTFEDLTISFAATEDTDATTGYSKDTETFTFGSEGTSITDKFVFEFTTTVDQEYRDDKFTVTTSNSFKNVSALTGSVPDPTGVDADGSPVNASDDATQTVTVPPIGKSGVYHQNATYSDDYGTVDYISWTVYLIRTP